jgi:7,8-dihydroneopterin aldolase/epimerase/oxygenase
VNAPLTHPASKTRAVLAYALRVRGLRLLSNVGVSDEERAAPQELVVAVEVELPGALYPKTDELSAAADYAAVVRIAERVAQERPYRLLETIALEIASRVGDCWPMASRARVAVTKSRVPVVPTPDEATVEVTLGPA